MLGGLIVVVSAVIILGTGWYTGRQGNLTPLVGAGMVLVAGLLLLALLLYFAL